MLAGGQTIENVVAEQHGGGQIGVLHRLAQVFRIALIAIQLTSHRQILVNDLQQLFELGTGDTQIDIVVPRQKTLVSHGT